MLRSVIPLLSPRAFYVRTAPLDSILKKVAISGIVQNSLQDPSGESKNSKKPDSIDQAIKPNLCVAGIIPEIPDSDSLEYSNWEKDFLATVKNIGQILENNAKRVESK